MRTQKMIMLIVLSAMLVVGSAVVAVFIWLGAGLGAVVIVAALVLFAAFFVWIIRPWYNRWGATDEELAVAMPGDDLIIPELQTLEVGEKILMMPGMGFEVTAIDPGRSIVSMLEGGTTSWCLSLNPLEAGGTRLVSRWRNKWGKITAANAFLIALTDPGTFIMEQKMLREIRKRAELSVHPIR